MWGRSSSVAYGAGGLFDCTLLCRAAMLPPTGSDDWSRGVAESAPASPTTEPTRPEGPQDAIGDKAPEGDKHYGDEMAVPSVFIGSATSFAEWDAAESARELQVEVTDLTRVLQGIISNIIWDQDMDADQKDTAIRAASTDFAERAGEAGGSSHEDDDRTGRRELGLDEMTAEELEEFRRSGQRAVATKKEGGGEFRAADFADVPDTATPSTWKLRLAAERSGNFTVAQVGRAITAMQPGGFRGNRVELGSSKDTVVGRIRRAIGKTGGSDEQKANLRERLSAVKELPLGDVSTFGVKAQADGSYRWTAIYTNRYADREREIFSDAAHKEFEAWVNGPDGVMPELRAWHVEGSKMGEADGVIYDADTGFMLATGVFDATRQNAAKALAEYSEPLGVSHGYTYPRSGLKEGVYSTYRTFEISPLPLGKAANLLTGFGLEVTMDDVKKDYLTKVFGAEETEVIMRGLGKLKAKAEADGLDYKDLATALVEEAPAPPGDPPAPPPEQSAGTPAAAPAGTPAPEPADQKDAAPSAGIVAAMKQAVDPMVEAINALDGGLKGLKDVVEAQAEEIVALKATDSDKVAAAMRPSRLAPHALEAFSASASKENQVRKDAADVKEAVADGGEAAAGLDYFKSTLLGPQAGQQPAPVAS